MKIVQAKKIHFPEILRLIGLYPKRLMQDLLPKPSEFFVAIVNGEIVGCCALEVYSRRLAEIRSLVVSPKFQRKGIGAKLLEKCLEKAKAKGIFEVLSITGTTKVFKRLGFRTFNREKYAMLKIL